MNYYLDYANKHFPWSKIKPCASNILKSKQESCDYIFAIPVGAKMYLWSMEIKDEQSGATKQICLLLQKTKNQNTFQKVYLPSVHMQPNIILYGTFLRAADKNQVFCIENILLFQNESQHEATWDTKIAFIHQILTESKLHSTLLGIPMFAKTVQELEQKAQKNDLYSVYSYMYCSLKKCKSSVFVCVCNKTTNFEEKRQIQNTQVSQSFDQQNVLDMLFGTENKETKKETSASTSTSTSAFALKSNSNSNSNPTLSNQKNKERTKILLVKPDVQNDIYFLFSRDKLTGQYTIQEGVALVPNYETSVLLNSKFRKIKENDNLDALEESDDEEEFEDSREDKFVNLSKSLLFQCTYNFKFKKWVPIKCQEN
jgi:hypothetical protein